MRPPTQVLRQFGRAVRDQRMKKGLTQQQLADACGLDISYIGGIERGQRNPTLGVIHSIAMVLGSKISEMTKKAKL